MTDRIGCPDCARTFKTPAALLQHRMDSHAILAPETALAPQIKLRKTRATINRPGLKWLAAWARGSFGVTREQLIEIVEALDELGYVLMPAEPTASLISASTVAMRESRGWIPGSKDEAQRVKHTIRYRAMIEQQRQALGLVPQAGGYPASAERAIAAVDPRKGDQ